MTSRKTKNDINKLTVKVLRKKLTKKTLRKRNKVVKNFNNTEYDLLLMAFLNPNQLTRLSHDLRASWSHMKSGDYAITTQ